MFRDVILDGANPGGNLGQSFAANINSTQLAPKGKFLDYLIIGLKGAVSIAPVTVTTALAAISQFTFKAGQETRIQLNGRDLVALMSAFYKTLPLAWQNTDNTGTTYVLGIKVPIQETIDNNISYTYSFNYTAQTNFATPVLSMTAVYKESDGGKKPILAVPVAYTTPAATGTTSVNSRLTNLGNMAGLLIFNTTAPTDAGDVYDIQRVQLVENGKQTSLLTGANVDPLPGIHGYADATKFGNVLQPYQYFDFSDEQVNVKDGYVEFIVDVETVSEATRLIPIIVKG